MLKAPGMKSLKPTYHKPLSSSAFNFNFRRYTSDIMMELLAEVKAGKP
jgi:hypothetical protein